MMLLSVKTCLALLWGISLLFSTDSVSASTPGTSSMYSTAEPNDKTTKAVIGANVGQNETHRATSHPTHKPAEVSVSATPAMIATPTMKKEDAIVTYIVHSSNDITTSSVAMDSAAATTASSSAPRLHHTSTAANEAASETQPSSNILETAKPTGGQSHQQSPSTVTDMIFSAATVPARAPATTKTAPATTNATTKTAPATTPASILATILATTPTTPAAALPTTPTTTPAAALPTTPTTAPATALPTTPKTTPTTALPTTPTTALPTTPKTTPATALPTTSVPLSTITPEAPSTSSSIASLDTATPTPVSNQTFSSPSASTAATASANLTSETTNSTELSSKSQPVSVTRPHNFTSEFTGTAGLSSTTELTTTTTSQTNSTNTTAASNSTILIPRVPKRLPIPTSKSTPGTTTVSRKASNNTEAKTCSTRGIVKQCLIAIASLAALATIFMVSTIVLCTKLSARKYKVTKPQTATEMMCISSLLPEREFIYTRQRNPVSNGVLVMHHGGDSDEDAGDNLTLSSFLPDNDRYV